MAVQKLELKLSLKAGDEIDGKYMVVKKLGEGGCGSVFRCQLKKNPVELVAVKVLENAVDLDRFEREIEVLKNADSLHVVGYRHTGRHLQFPYLAMEHMAGGSLRDYLDAKKTLPAKEAAWIAIMAIRGLKDCGTVHRDLKPENLLLTKAPEGKVAFIIGNVKKASVVKVADFGLAKQPDPKRTKLTMTGQIMGTPLYMSPEQCQSTKNVDERGDIYAMGILLYEMVTGDTPFTSNDPYVLLDMHQKREPTFPRMDQQMQQVIATCLKKNPERRYQRLKDLEYDLAKIAGIGRSKGGGGKTAEGLSEGGRWILVGAGMLIFCTLAYLLRDEVLSAFNAWWDPKPASSQPAPMVRDPRIDRNR
jgi:serine/threonine-protein kinase